MLSHLGVPLLALSCIHLLNLDIHRGNQNNVVIHHINAVYPLKTVPIYPKVKVMYRGQHLSSGAATALLMRVLITHVGAVSNHARSIPFGRPSSASGGSTAEGEGAEGGDGRRGVSPVWRQGLMTASLGLPHP